MKINPFLCEFSSKDDEKVYRYHYLKSDANQIIVGVIIVIIATMAFIPSDFNLFGHNTEFIELLTFRGIFILFSIIAITGFLKIKNILFFDLLLFFWLFILCLVIFLINNTRPVAYLQHSYIDIPTVIFIFVLFTNRIYYQIIPAVLFSVINISLLVLKDAASTPIAFNSIIIAYVLSIIIGSLVSWRYHIFRRKQYKAWINEKKVKEDLLKANENVKVLAGLMPICSSCKKIRDDKGYWKQIEEYIEKHSEAQFSHSLCEDCAEKLYGDQDWFRE
jgi:hypothetical protein